MAGAGAFNPLGVPALSQRGRPRIRPGAPQRAWVLAGWKEALTLLYLPCQVCTRTMGAALGTGTRLAPWPGRACGALPRWAPSTPAQGCHSKPGPARPVPLKKRGYDVTRNPHLNKVMGPRAGLPALRSRGCRKIAPRPLDLERILPAALPAVFLFLPCRGLL